MPSDTVIGTFCHSEGLGESSLRIFLFLFLSPGGAAWPSSPEPVLTGAGRGAEAEQRKAPEGDAEPEGRASPANPGSSVRRGLELGGESQGCRARERTSRVCGHRVGVLSQAHTAASGSPSPAPRLQHDVCDYVRGRACPWTASAV